MDKNTVNSKLTEIYYNLEGPGGFGGVTPFYREVKKRFPSITRKQIISWLRSQETYGVHLPYHAKIPRSRIIVKGIDYLWEMDLMDMSLLSRYNKGFKFVLLVIDVFSKYVWVRPVKSKNASIILDMVKNIMKESGRTPRYIRTDKGTEFVNRVLSKFLNSIHVEHIQTHSEVKAAFAERAIKTIKGKLFKYMYHFQTRNYINILNKVVKVYNATIHSTIKMAPKNVTHKNETQLWWSVYANISGKGAIVRNIAKGGFLNEGDYVRVSFLRGVFDREYRQKWSSEIYQVYKRRMRDGVMVYWLRDLGGEELKGTFYRQELELANYDAEGIYKIEKIIRQKKEKDGRVKYFVKWLNWPDKFNSWVYKDQIEKI